MNKLWLFVIALVVLATVYSVDGGVVAMPGAFESRVYHYPQHHHSSTVLTRPQALLNNRNPTIPPFRSAHRNYPNRHHTEDGSNHDVFIGGGGIGGGHGNDGNGGNGDGDGNDDDDDDDGSLASSGLGLLTGALVKICDHLKAKQHPTYPKRHSPITCQRFYESLELSDDKVHYLSTVSRLAQRAMWECRVEHVEDFWLDFTSNDREDRGIGTKVTNIRPACRRALVALERFI
jgi:hypothetical protein